MELSQNGSDDNALQPDHLFQACSAPFVFYGMQHSKANSCCLDPSHHLQTFTALLNSGTGVTSRRVFHTS